MANQTEKFTKLCEELNKNYDNDLHLQNPSRPSVEEQLMELVAQITPDNLHAEIDTGEAIGQEVW